MPRSFQVLFILMTCGAVLAAAPLPAAATPQEASAFVSGVGNQALSIMSAKGSPQAQKLQKIEDLFIKNVDIDWVAKFVLGKYWRTASEEQKKRYLSNYQTFLIKHYTSRFVEYSNESFKITGAHAGDAPNEYQLTMELIRPGKENVIVEYRVRQSGAQFKIFDIIVEGVSLITTQRSEFASVIDRNGLDYLVDQLEKKTRQVTEKINAATQL